MNGFSNNSYNLKKLKKIIIIVKIILEIAITFGYVVKSFIHINFFIANFIMMFIF